MEEEDHQKTELIISGSGRVDDDLKKLALKVNHHEKNLAFLNTDMRAISESILDAQVKLGKQEEPSHHEHHMQIEKHTIDYILQQEKTAAGIIWQLKIHHGLQASKLPWMKDVLGVVATLGSVKDDNLSRLLSEYLGLETMLAVVCKTLGSIKALERYDKEGMIDMNVGLHCLGPSIGRQLDGRFLAICLETLRVYPGEFLADDSQKRLDLLKPRLPNGSFPPGFLGFAVNMIDLDRNHLTCLTTNGHGLRETLFYSLFSRLQVYRSRFEMELAVPFISDGAISLDGGMIRCNGLFYLGSRKDVIVRFPINSGKPTVPVEILEIEEQLKLLQWKQERLAEDILREEVLLKQVKELFHTKREELRKFLIDAKQYISKVLPK